MVTFLDLGIRSCRHRKGGVLVVKVLWHLESRAHTQAQQYLHLLFQLLHLLLLFQYDLLLLGHQSLTVFQLQHLVLEEFVSLVNLSFQFLDGVTSLLLDLYPSVQSVSVVLRERSTGVSLDLLTVRWLWVVISVGVSLSFLLYRRKK